MNQSLTTGRWQLGLGLSLFTTVLFGILPIVLKGLLASLDVYTLTWFRFLLAAIVMTMVVTPHSRLAFTKFNRLAVGLLILAGGSLCANYLLFLVGLRYVTPSTAQVLMQLTPILLLLGSLLLFGEPYSPKQWLGLGLLLLGLVLYFNRQLGPLVSQLTGDTIGILLMFASALTWAVYGLAQKRLTQWFPATFTALFVYWLGTFIFWPLAEPARLLQLDRVIWLPLTYSALSTFLVYWAFAEALNHWAASRISAVLALGPIVTVVAVQVISTVWPGWVQPEPLSLLSMGGILLVITGSMLSALGRAL